jgi:mycothiol system anti-sigma-R factor
MESEDSGLDCNKTIERLYFFLDGELTEERRTEIRIHLDDCSPCLGAFDFEAELRQVIASRCKDHVPDSLRQRVLDAILEEERQAGR